MIAISRRETLNFAGSISVLSLMPTVVAPKSNFLGSAHHGAALALVAANRYLVSNRIVDAYGHISLRHPTNKDRFLLSRSKSPALVEIDDILEFDLSGSPISTTKLALYVERFVHAGVYASRPHVNAVIYGNRPDSSLFAVELSLKPRMENLSIAASRKSRNCCNNHFETSTFLINNIRIAANLAKVLGQDQLILMKHHGFIAAHNSLTKVLQIAIGLTET